MKTTEINGTTFEMVKANTKRGQGIINTFNSRYMKGFEDLYKNPSETKKAIYKDWENFFSSSAIIKACGNCMTFSLYVEDNSIYFYITKTHNIVVVD